MKTVKVGLFGFGVVGEGIYKVLSQKQQLGVEVKKIVIKHPEKDRDAPAHLFSVDKDDILKDEEIDLVVELINDAEAALSIVTEAMKLGKSVVSANKKMIANNHTILIEVSKDNLVSFLYEAAVCGSVPIIRNLEEYFDNDLLTHIQGIVNGSTNYILSKMYSENSDYRQALESAKENGFAESDPTLDVEGIDAAYKLSIILLHAFGKRIYSSSIVQKGITSLHPFDFKYAKEKDFVIKLIAQCLVDENGIITSVSVLPTFIGKSNTLGLTNNEYNGILVGSTLADEQFFYGKGAGRYPTSSAVLSDISAYKYGYKYEYKKGYEPFDAENKSLGRFYIGFEKEKEFDDSIFESIEERFIGNDRVYFVGRITYNQLKESKLLNDKGISVISFS